MNNKLINSIVFVLSVICLIITALSFYNMGILVEEFNTSPDVVYGGTLWLYLNWGKLALLVVISVLSGINLFTIKNK